ncbi:hypothetical protein ACFL6C_01610 [Myxococcota bacterium]
MASKIHNDTSFGPMKGTSDTSEISKTKQPTDLETKETSKKGILPEYPVGGVPVTTHSDSGDKGERPGKLVGAGARIVDDATSFCIDGAPKTEVGDKTGKVVGAVQLDAPGVQLVRGLVERPSDHFDAAYEFPPLFLFDNIQLSPDGTVALATPSPQQLAKAEESLSSAVGSLLNRIAIPTEKGEIRPLFEELRRKIQHCDPGAEVYASAGVVRSCLGFVYERIHEGLANDPPIHPHQILAEITNDETLITEDVVRIKSGSDWDVFVRPSDPEAHPKGANRQLWNRIRYAVGLKDSEGSVFELGHDVFARAVGFDLDLKPWAQQMQRTMRQGGNSIDLLSFAVDRAEFVEPDGMKGIVSDLLLGKHRFLLSDWVDLENPEDTILRGIRPMLELPWLSLDPESCEILENALKKVEEQIEKGIPLNERASGQFDKAIRNARFAGAHNRIFRGAPNSLEETVLKVAQAASEKGNGPLLPRFVARRPAGTGSELKAQLPQQALLDIDNFITQYTNGTGDLYHGTPSIEQALAIFRSGMFLSDSRLGQGHSICGPGGYLTPDRKTACGYEGAEGLAFSVSIKRESSPTILDWKKFAQSTEGRALAKAHGIDPSSDDGRDAMFDFLGSRCGVDLILNGYLVCLNTAVLSFPESIRDVALAYAEKLSTTEGMEFIGVLRGYKRAFDVIEGYEKASGAEGPLIPPGELATKHLHKLETAILDWVTTLSPNRTLDEIRRHYNTYRQQEFPLGPFASAFARYTETQVQSYEPVSPWDRPYDVYRHFGKALSWVVELLEHDDGGAAPELRKAGRKIIARIDALISETPGILEDMNFGVDEISALIEQCATVKVPVPPFAKADGSSLEVLVKFIARREALGQIG